MVQGLTGAADITDGRPMRAFQQIEEEYPAVVFENPNAVFPPPSTQDQTNPELHAQLRRENPLVTAAKVVGLMLGSLADAVLKLGEGEGASAPSPYGGRGRTVPQASNPFEFRVNENGQPEYKDATSNNPNDWRAMDVDGTLTTTGDGGNIPNDPRLRRTGPGDEDGGDGENDDGEGEGIGNAESTTQPPQAPQGLSTGQTIEVGAAGAAAGGLAIFIESARNWISDTINRPGGKQAIADFLNSFAEVAPSLPVEQQTEIYQGVFTELIENGVDVEGVVLDLVHSVLNGAHDRGALNEKVALLERAGILYELGSGTFNGVLAILGTGQVLRVGDLSPGEPGLAEHVGQAGLGPEVDLAHSVILRRTAGSGEETGTAHYGAMVMERIDGPTWQALADLPNQLPFEQVKAHVGQLAETVAEFHARFGIHGDLKGENSFITDEGVLLIDFAFNAPIEGNQHLFNAEFMKMWRTMVMVLLPGYQPPWNQVKELMDGFEHAYLSKVNELEHAGAIDENAASRLRSAFGDAFGSLRGRFEQLYNESKINQEFPLAA